MGLAGTEGKMAENDGQRAEEQGTAESGPLRTLRAALERVALTAERYTAAAAAARAQQAPDAAADKSLTTEDVRAAVRIVALEQGWFERDSDSSLRDYAGEDERAKAGFDAWLDGERRKWLDEAARERGWPSWLAVPSVAPEVVAMMFDAARDVPLSVSIAPKPPAEQEAGE